MSEKLKQMSKDELLQLMKENMLRDLSTFSEKDVLIKKKPVRKEEPVLATT